MKKIKLFFDWLKKHIGPKAFLIPVDENFPFSEYAKKEKTGIFGSTPKIIIFIFLFLLFALIISPVIIIKEKWNTEFINFYIFLWISLILEFSITIWCFKTIDKMERNAYLRLQAKKEKEEKL